MFGRHFALAAGLVWGSVAGTTLSAADKLNVLLIVIDDLNNDLGCYGHPMVKSPSIDRLAARGVRFDRAYCQYPVCNPSRSSFLTGLYPQQTGVLSNGGDFRKKLPEVVTLPQHFMNHGYFTARVGKIFHYGVPGQIGSPGEDDPASWNATVNPRGRDKDDEPIIKSIRPDSRSFGGTLSWLAADGTDDEQTDGIGAAACMKLMEDHHPAKTGKPFFIAMGFYRPHTPYVAPRKYFDMYPRDQIEPVKDPPNDRDDIPPAALADRPGQLGMSDDRKREVIQAYYAATTFMDAQVGRVVDALDRLKLAESTVVLFVSDHGYHLGRHGLWQKSDLFEAGCRVPMILATPGMRTAGRATASLAELTDIYPTLADLCGLPRPGHVMGKTLRPVLDDPTKSVRDSAYTVSNARGKIPNKPPGGAPLGYTVRTERYRYTEWGDDARFGVELYDHQNDPFEYTNLAQQPGNEAWVTQMKRLLADRKAAAK